MAGFRVVCSNCNEDFGENPLIGKCPFCKGKITVEYPDEKLIRFKEALRREVAGMWRYGDYLPVNSRTPVSLGEGFTPLQRGRWLPEILGIKNLLFKDETRNPTGSFLDRGSSIVVTSLVERGVSWFCSPAKGNLGASLAAYAAKAGVRYTAYVPHGVNTGKLYQMLIYGAEVKVAGRYEECVEKALKKGNCVLDTLPFFIEGKKTVIYEIIEQLNWKQPDVIITPAGTGALIHSIFKGTNELVRAGVINEIEFRIVGVQAEACPPIAKAFERGLERVKPVKPHSTVAGDIAIGNPEYGCEALDAVRKTGGTFVTVTDGEMLEAMRVLASKEAILAEPLSAATVAALKKLVDIGWIDREEVVVCLITGSGLKVPKVIYKSLREARKTLKFEEEVLTYKIGRTKLILLKAIAKKPSYGYELKKRLLNEYGLNVTLPTIYTHLADLKRWGLIEEKSLGYRGKTYYMLTEKGKRMLQVLEGLLRGEDSSAKEA